MPVLFRKTPIPTLDEFPTMGKISSHKDMGLWTRPLRSLRIVNQGGFR